MYYIVFDLEFNQAADIAQTGIKDCREHQPEEPQASQQALRLEEPAPTMGRISASEAAVRLPFEILQVGALKLNTELQTVAVFNRLVKPSLYPTVNPFITGLTGITTEQLYEEVLFPEVYQDFTAFIGDTEAVFCIWGKSDIKELFRNASYHALNMELLPRRYINLQPYASLQLGYSRQKQLQLKDTAEALSIPLSLSFHDAGNDAFYTAEIFKKLYNPSIQPTIFEPNNPAPRTRISRKTIDFDGLLHQFEKMYGREMSGEEQEIIKLAYQMGRTRQFLKEQ